MNTKSKTIAVLMAAIMVSAVIAPMAIGQSPGSSAIVGNVAPYVCSKWEADPTAINTPVTQVLPVICPGNKTVAIAACVCDGNNNSDIANVTATVTAPALTLSDDELGTEFAKLWGPATAVTITDISGSGVRFNFTGLSNTSGTGVGDNFPVSQNAGGAWKTYGITQPFSTWGDFSGYTWYSLYVKNVGADPVKVNLDLNTGWTIPPPEYANATIDTFWQNAWTDIGVGETKLITLYFSSANVWGASDDPVAAWQYPDNTDGVQVRRLDEVSQIGFQVLGNGAGSIVVSASKTVTLSPDPNVDCTGYTCTLYPSVNCTGYLGTFNMSCSDPAGNYTVNVTVTDNGSLSNSTVNIFEYQSIISLAIDFNAVNFGAVDPGNRSEVYGDGVMETPTGTTGPGWGGDVNATVQNRGNDPMNVSIIASAMAGGTTTPIPASALKANVSELGEQSLGTVQVWSTELESNERDKIDFALVVPAGTLPGSYTGTITITGIRA